METYVPTPGGGILGGQGDDGELDGIQAWKKGMKEREKKGKEAEVPTDSAQKVDAAQDKRRASPAAGGLDEIQMFKLLMKEAAKPDEGSPTQPSPAQNAPTLNKRSLSGKEDDADKSCTFRLSALVCRPVLTLG